MICSRIPFDYWKRICFLQEKSEENMEYERENDAMVLVPYYFNGVWHGARLPWEEYMAMETKVEGLAARICQNGMNSLSEVEQAEYAFLNAIVESQMLFASSESLRKAITEKRVVKDTVLEAMMGRPFAKPEGEKAHKKVPEDEA